MLYGSSAGLRTDNDRRLTSGSSRPDALGWQVTVMPGTPTLIVAGAPDLNVGGIHEAAWVGQGLGGARAPSGAHDDLLARTEKSEVGLIGLVGRIDPTTGRRVATYTTNWGSSLITGFGNAAR